MQNSIPIYKFATLRNPTDVVVPSDVVNIQPTTTFVTDLITINENSDSNAQKLEDFNSRLQTFINSDSFIKTKLQFDTLKTSQDANPNQAAIDLLYDNILVRSLTKSSTNYLYKLIVEQLKSIYIAVNSLAAETEFNIIIPERLIFTFADYIDTDPDPTSPDFTEQNEIIQELNDLSEMEELLAQAREENVISFNNSDEVVIRNLEYSMLNASLRTSNISVTDAETTINAKITELETAEEATRNFNQDIDTMGTVESSINTQAAASETGVNELRRHYDELKFQINNLPEGVTDIEDTKTISSDKYASILTNFSKTSLNIDEAEKLVEESMNLLTKEFHKIVNLQKYCLLGDRWVETSKFDQREVNNTSGGIMSHPNDCTLKTPFQIADLRVIEQLPVGYLPGEIAHINNTQSGEKNTKVTRRLKKVDSYESLITDEEVFRETDTQSTERSGMESEASKAQTAASSFNINASVSGSYGPMSATVDTGYSNSNSTTNANSNSQYQAKEIVKSIVDRVSNRVHTERSVRTIEEFEETVTHEIDNSIQGTKSYVYRWLNKLVRATLKNYGKRLIFQFDIAHPAHYYISRAIKDMPTVNLPPDPRELSVDGTKILTIENITRDNYLAWGAIYKVDLEQAPTKKIIVSEVLNGTEETTMGKLIPIKKDYKCIKAVTTCGYRNGWPKHNYIVFSIGNGASAFWNGQDSLWNPRITWLKGETEQLPTSIMAGEQGFIVNIEIECDLTKEAYKAWKINCYNTIVDAYERLKAEAESELSAFNPNMPGMHPMKKKQVIKDEIKKETIRKMFKCNPFWVNDKYEVGKEYTPNCCLDSSNAERARFIENAFDWENLTYEFYPYFYADKDYWSQILDLSDSDPHFEAFLQASYATIRVPVHRDSLKEIAAINFVMNNSIANYEVIPQDIEPILDELKDNQTSLFTYDLDGNEIAVPTNVVDLGVFILPTSLVILECGNTDGIAPIGFPQSEDAPTSDIIIPKQYSPAIIADSCDTPE